jgi:hypothetical protein
LRETGTDGLLPDYHVGVEHGKVERPMLWGPAAQLLPVVLDDTPRNFLGRLVGPRHEERHDVWIMNPIGSQIGHSAELFGRGQAQFESWRCQP